MQGLDVGTVVHYTGQYEDEGSVRPQMQASRVSPAANAEKGNFALRARRYASGLRCI